MTTTSKVHTIIDGLRTRISSGEFGQDGRLPSFRKLVLEYNTSQETMNKAMQALQAEGLIISSGAKGVFVNARRIRMPNIVVDFPTYLKEQGFKPSSQFIEKPQVIDPPASIRKAMKLKKGEKVLLRLKKQGTEDALFRVTTEYYPMDLINKEMLDQILEEPHFSIILAIKEHFGVTIQFAEEELIARLPNTEEQKILQIVRTNPIIESTSINYSSNKEKAVVYYKKLLNANHFILSYDYEINYWE
jgi:GntR family transcriptional regulator